MHVFIPSVYAQICMCEYVSYLFPTVISLFGVFVSSTIVTINSYDGYDDDHDWLEIIWYIGASVICYV